jgi:hypothetical protein
MNYSSKEHKGFRTFLRESFPKPKFDGNGRLVSPLISSSPSLIGTAFDYLLRFHLQKKFQSKVQSTGWVSEKAINGYFKEKGISYQSFGFVEDLNANDIKELFAIKKKAHKRFEWCKRIHAKFLRSEQYDSAQLLEACLFLARLDNIYRRDLPTVEELRSLFVVRKDDIVELESLIACCSLEQFKPNSHIILNPTFGTNIVSADADLVVDDMLIEVKVTKHLKLSHEYYNQLIGYYLLYLIGGISGKRKINISKLGIYFARHAILWTVNVDQIANRVLFGKATSLLKRSLKRHPL